MDYKKVGQDVQDQEQLVVIGIGRPWFDKHSIVQLKAQGFYGVVDQDRFIEVSTQGVQVLDVFPILDVTRVSVETMTKDGSLGIQVVQNPVGIAFVTSCKSDDFKMPRILRNAFLSVWITSISGTIELESSLNLLETAERKWICLN